MNEPLCIGDTVWSPDGHEWTVTAIGGQNHTVIHVKREVHKRFALSDLRPAKILAARTERIEHMPGGMDIR